jgi:heat shock protein HtpX
MTRAKPVTREQNPLLWNITENLSITAGLPMPRLYIIDDPAPNAFATGRNKEHAVVAVTSGLLAMMDRSELEGVIAHELSHIGNKDILLSTVVVVLAGMAVMISDMFFRISLFGGGGNRGNKGGQLQAVIVVVGIIFAALSPIIATIIRLSISRKREFLADASGALLTRYPEGLASALKKLGSYGQKMQSASGATAHLFISNPFGGRDASKVSFVQKLFMTHPPMNERVNALLGGDRSAGNNH